MAGESEPARVLLVEGVDDKHVVKHLRNHQDHPDVPEFDILDKKGYPNLADAIGLEIKVSGRVAVGILADANDDLDGRWNSVTHRLREVGLNPPAATTAGGTIIEGTPRVGIWLMPDNTSAGELEDFVERLIPTGDPVWPRAHAYIDDIPVADRRFIEGKIQRARIHAWLATRREPRKMGAAIGAGELDVTVPLAVRFTAWLRELFR